MLSTKKGFTLIELLVTITILAIVFGVVLTSGAALQRNARDAQRKSDIATLQGVLQQYYADNQYYPSSLPAEGSAFNSLSGGGSTTTTKIYLKQIPADPTNVRPYKYVSYKDQQTLSDCDNAGDKCQYYVFCAQMENNTDDTYDCSGTDYNYQKAPN